MSATASNAVGRQAPVSRLTAGKGRYQAIYAIVRRIPLGRVATYGQVARLAGFPGCARQVGYALSALADKSGVPWQRVINAQGRVSLRFDCGPGDCLQRLKLQSEGVVFNASGRIPLEIFQWRPEPPGYLPGD